MNNCTRCGSEKVIPDIRIIDQEGNSIRRINVYDHPEALVFKGAHPGALNSQVCGECGYVESYVENPQELYKIHLAAQPPKG